MRSHPVRPLLFPYLTVYTARIKSVWKWKTWLQCFYTTPCNETRMTKERVSTGVPGLDKFVNGGIPQGSIVLVSGGPGTGKTIFCSQYLWHGLQNGENCVFITLEEDEEDIREDVEQFGWDFTPYEEEGRMAFVQLNPFKDGVGFTDHVRKTIEEVDADRVVIDSISVMGIHQQTLGEIRKSIYDLVKKLKKHDVTALITAEIPHDGKNKLSRYGVEEFITDGAIMLTGLSFGSQSFRSVQVIKMRKTKITGDVGTLEITDKGLYVKPSAV